MKGEKLGTEMESDVDSDRRHLSSSFVKTHNEYYAISKSVNYKTSSKLSLHKRDTGPVSPSAGV